jgi:predicted hotdog family 3-hydroxylacyl-ACP dehydratase
MFFVDFWDIFSLMLIKKRYRPMIDIESFIPHREPIKIITEIIELNDNDGIASAVVNEHWPLCEGWAVRSLVLIEAIAQTAALVEGYKRKKQGKDGTKGWLVGIKSAEFKQDFIELDTRITVFVRSLYAFEQYGVIEGIVKSGDDILLTAILQAMRLNHDVS